MPTIMVEKIKARVEVFDDKMGSEARLNLLAKKAKRLSGRGRRLPKGFQLEPIDPEKVGLDQETSDFYSPEQLVELFSHPRKTVDWDRLDELNSIGYFYEGE